MDKQRLTQFGKSLGETAKTQALALGTMLGVLWLVSAINLGLLSGTWNQMGIAPRTAPGLLGILLAPLLHGSFGHAAANSLPLLVLAWMSMLSGLSGFVLATACAWLLGGLGTWLFGASGSVHIGASGLVFGYLGYLLTAALVQRSLRAIALSLVAAMLYGGIVWGVLPGQSSISWEGHLFGFIGGAVAAKLMTSKEPSVPSSDSSPTLRL